jgi:2-oxoglutarate ferredoxin oxidoreductase subunit delta
VEINRDYCKKCGLCYWICPTQAIAEGDYGRPEVADHDKCIGCMQCERICPDFAINIVERSEEHNKK